MSDYVFATCVDDKMEHGSERERDQSPEFRRPNMSELRIVLLGQNSSENNRVGNFILNKNQFVTKTSVKELQTFNGTVEEINVTVISSTHLLNPELKLHKMQQKVSEVSSLNPHAIILVLQHNDFSESNRDRLSSVLNFFVEPIKKCIMILTTDETNDNEQKPIKENKFIQEISTEFGAECLKFKGIQRSQIPKKVYKLMTLSRSKEEEQSSSLDQVARPKVFRKSKKQKLNIVFCGHNAQLKSSILQLLLGKKTPMSVQDVSSLVCVKREQKICGRHLCVVDLPSLSVLSEEEVTRQTLLSVSLCQTGVHAFIIVLPVGSLSYEEKTEVEKILKIFYSRDHFVLLFTNMTSVELATEFIKHSSDSQDLISHCGGQYRLMPIKEPENSRQIPDLLDYIENMKTEPYSLQMFVKAQENRVRRELEEQHKNKLSEMENKIKELQERIQSNGSKEVQDDLECVRIVLIGKTGNGKSATGNTILGRDEFVIEASMDSVTTVCEKRVGEVDGRSVSVVDTPGLFDTTLENKQVAEEIMKCVLLSSPGPHVFVIVLNVGRFTEEEADTLDLIRKIFGPKSAQFSIVLFTRGDELRNKTIQDYVDRSSKKEPKKLIRDCGDRFIAFNNNEKHDRTQVTRLLKMIEELKNTNQGRFFTNSMFEEAEINIKYRIEEIMKEKEREIQKEREELKAQYDMGMNDMMKRLEEEKQRADEERMNMENRFREKEEKLKRDIEAKEEKERKKQETEYQKLLDKEKQQRAENHLKIEELKRENENQKAEYKKQQKQREEEDRKREEKYRQDQEKMRTEQEQTIAELKCKQKEEMKKRESDEKRKNKQEEEERQEWEKKIKEAENERKEIQEEIKRQQREWEDENKQQMNKREEEEQKRKEKHEDELREKQEELEKMRTRFEREREEERQKMEELRQKQRRDREEKEREYEEKKQEKIRHYEQLERERKEEWERRKRDDEERREEERKRWKRNIEDLKQEQEEEMKRREREEKKRKDKEERERDEIKKEYEEKMKEMKKTHEAEVRKQAEESNDFREKNKKQIQEYEKMLEDRQKQHELLEQLNQHLQRQTGEEIKELKKQVQELKSNSSCVIL